MFRLDQLLFWFRREAPPPEVFAAVRCPVLLLGGSLDRTVSSEGSLEDWRDRFINGASSSSSLSLPCTTLTPLSHSARRGQGAQDDRGRRTSARDDRLEPRQPIRPHLPPALCVTASLLLHRPPRLTQLRPQTSSPDSRPLPRPRRVLSFHIASPPIPAYPHIHDLYPLHTFLAKRPPRCLTNCRSSPASATLVDVSFSRGAPRRCGMCGKLLLLVQAVRRTREMRVLVRLRSWKSGGEQ